MCVWGEVDTVSVRKRVVEIELECQSALGVLGWRRTGSWIRGPGF